MRINLQKFAFSTLTFSLATTLAVGGFSESANAQRTSGGASYGTSNNIPALNFEVFLKNEDGTDIKDAKDDDNLGVFKNAIEIINDGDQILTNVPEDQLQEESGADVKINGNFDNGNFANGTVASLSAELDDNKITYQIFLGHDYKSPTDFLKFAPVDISSRPNDKVNLVNNLEFILGDGNQGQYNTNENEDGFDKNKIGVLGQAIESSLIFDDIEFFKIAKFDSPPSTSIPEPTTTLASLFALAFAGKFLRKSKKSNA